MARRKALFFSSRDFTREVKVPPSSSDLGQSRSRPSKILYRARRCGRRAFTRLKKFPKISDDQNAPNRAAARTGLGHL